MRNIHIFISHSWKYDTYRQGLANLLDKRKYFGWSDFSVPPDDPIHTDGSDEELYNAIKNKISGSSIVIVLAGVYASYSKWMKKEIEIAKDGFSSPKPILAVEYKGSQRVSQLVSDNADKIVKWNTESIVSSIRDLTTN